MSDDPIDRLKVACREAWFGVANRFAKGAQHSELSAAFELYWADNGERLAVLASRCTTCIGFHRPGEPCEAAVVRREREAVEHLTDFSNVFLEPLHFKSLPPMPPLQNIRPAKTTSWGCRNPACPKRTVHAESAPRCYTCGATMVAA